MSIVIRSHTHSCSDSLHRHGLFCTFFDHRRTSFVQRRWVSPKHSRSNTRIRTDPADPTASILTGIVVDSHFQEALLLVSHSLSVRCATLRPPWIQFLTSSLDNSCSALTLCRGHNDGAPQTDATGQPGVHPELTSRARISASWLHTELPELWTGVSWPTDLLSSTTRPSPRLQGTFQPALRADGCAAAPSTHVQ